MEITDSLVGKIRKIARITDLILQEQLAPLNITLAEFRLVGLLLGSSGMQPKELARSLGISPASLSATLQKLLKKKILIKIIDPSDKRASLVTISPETDLRQVFKVITAVEGKALSDLENSDSFRMQLDKVLKNLEGES